jgi:hypothetical protein
MKLGSLIGATALVTLTTADDAVWLVAYTKPSLPLSTRVTHAALFVATLVVLAIGCVIVASVFEYAVDANDLAAASSSKWLNQEVLLGSIGAVICWLIAGKDGVC